MLTLEIEPVEYYNDETETFESRGGGTIRLEHSLLAMSKWEMRWKRPFLHAPPETSEELIHYIKCMSVDGEIPEELIYGLTTSQVRQVSDYLADPATASSVTSRQKDSKSKEQTTTELIYYWMVALQIPFECETWHINRLLMLVRICNIKNRQADPKAPKMSQDEIVQDYRRENERRRAMLGTKG